MRPSLHGFWGKGISNRGTPPSEGGLSDVLVVYSPAYLGSIYTTDVNPTAIYAQIQTTEIAAGYTTELIASYSNFLTEDLSKYAHIWDIGYATRLDNPAVIAKYTAYLAGGGAAFLLGENAGFILRNTDICGMIQACGGGAVMLSSDTYGIITVDTASEFLLANQNGSVTFSAPGAFSAIGTGTSFTTGGAHAVMWKTGALANAPRGAIVSVLDINFLSSNIQRNFIDNLAICLNKK